MYRTYKRKLKLTAPQETRVRSWIGASRLVYNMALEIRIAAYKNLGKSIHRFELMKQLKDIRAEYEWMRDAPSQVLAMAVIRLDNSYSRFFKGGGFPQFASKKTFKSIQFKDIRIKQGLPIIAKLGVLNIFKDEPFIGTPKTASISLEPTGFFINITCADVPSRFNSDNQAIGLDMGISHFCVNSNGDFIDNPRHFKKHERRLRIENRSLARKKKGSNRWNKQARKMSLLHHKIGNVRRDFLHKESTKIAKLCTIVYMEDLNISGMAKNKKLSKHILDAGWGMFKTFLSYKTNVVLVDPKYTSQTCNKCGVPDAASRLSQSEFLCTGCGHSENADYNAALNILSRGTAVSRQREAIA